MVVVLGTPMVFLGGYVAISLGYSVDDVMKVGSRMKDERDRLLQPLDALEPLPSAVLGFAFILRFWC